MAGVSPGTISKLLDPTRGELSKRSLRKVTEFYWVKNPVGGLGEREGFIAVLVRQLIHLLAPDLDDAVAQIRRLGELLRNSPDAEPWMHLVVGWLERLVVADYAPSTSYVVRKRKPKKRKELPPKPGPQGSSDGGEGDGEDRTPGGDGAPPKP